MEQKIISNNKEPRDAIKAKVTIKTKTNADVRDRIVDGLRSTIIKNRDKVGMTTD